MGMMPNHIVTKCIKGSFQTKIYIVGPGLLSCNLAVIGDSVIVGGGEGGRRNGPHFAASPSIDLLCSIFMADWLIGWLVDW